MEVLHAGAMAVSDPFLPAAPHLMGPDAGSALACAVNAHGGRLIDAHPVQVQHRPGHEVVVRYDATVAWAGRTAQRETLLAAATTSGTPAGTVPVAAGDLEAGVWRYPFDPVLPGLASAVTPGALDELLAGHLAPHPDLAVVAYRPLRRAVVQACDGRRTAYVKVVLPSEARSIADHHERLRHAGLPVPVVLGLDADRGLLVLDALPGRTLRDRLLDQRTDWPTTPAYADLLDQLRSVPLPSGATAAMTALEAAPSHARALTAIVPSEARRLDRVLANVHHDAGQPSHLTTIHGDLYEAQLLVDGAGRITGLLDLDDVSAGDAMDDAATLLAHLHILQPATRLHREQLARYRRLIRADLVGRHVPGADRAALDRRTAAVLLGLATGPFRAQRHRWVDEVRRRLAMADALSASREKTLRRTSSTRHPQVGQRSRGVAPAAPRNVPLT